MGARRPLLLGHRGARRYAPENTLPAFELALAHGCDGFEFDVRLTVDAQCVICHDPRPRGQEVAQARFASLAAPCLEDVFRQFSKRAYLDIELKVPGLEAMTAALVCRYPPRRGYCVSSFLPEVVRTLHREDASLQLGLICDSCIQLADWPTLPIQALFLKQVLVNARLVQELQAAGKQVMVWTVNRGSDMRRFAAMGVDGIISDDTELLARTLAKA